MSKRFANKPTGSSYLQRKGSSQQAEAKKDDLLSKEEEYKRLNEELEKKTAHLVYEAEQVLRENEKLLNDSDYYHKIDTEPVFEFLKAEKMGYPVEESTNYEQTASELMMPKAANEMSNEAQIRFFKAKLKVLQEEVEKYGTELAKKDEENFKLAQRCKELEEERVKQLRISNSHQTQMEKYKKSNDEAQQKIGQLETQMKLVKNENEQLKRDSKKGGQDMQHLELRLNRSLEEIEKLKLELNKQMNAKKNLNEQDKGRIESLQNENKKLNKQKLELIQAFKRQIKLIDNLKKQKMHLEASRLLQFCEQEFISALDWNPNAMESVPSTKPNSRPPSGLNRSAINKNETRKNSNKNIKNLRSSSMASLEQNDSNNNAETISNLENLDFGSESDFD
ncbi:testis-expressed sequence 9 [Brachionus plicatilis]|uniref:Testis-expressed sequence 9 n=1 Tax=Brachionus plicatilis TaxID=10195 RepID=A0A3M7S6T1_BRAPC|nr:testis-expressed sequence 9 [Brachionus plicatilis]